jgi:DnaJ-domain-containing protein 1
MFERNPVDNTMTATVAVELSLDDGSVVTGRAAMPPGRLVHKLMDGAEAFLFVETFAGESCFVPKTSIKGLKLIATAKPQPLRVLGSDAASFDPWKALGLEKGAAFDDVKAAYHRLTKQYHPDAYAGVVLPPEVATYIDARCKQINAAFRVLRSSRKAEPVYVSANTR